MRKFMIYAAAFVFSAALQAQDLDPTVEVSRVYEGKLIEVRKPVMEMAVPDTLYRFDLDFDYSVFDNPYRGTYEFNPYMLDMRPESDLKKPSNLYLKAGAGYTLHPVFDVLWSPEIKGPFSVDVFGTHKSYIGEYRPVGGNDAFKGYDLLSRAGADFGYDWKKAGLDFGASYYGVAVKDLAKERSYNAVDAYAVLASKTLWPESFMYKINLAYRYASDASRLSEHDFDLDATFGPSLGGGNKVFFDLGVGMNSYAGALDMRMARFYVVPHYVCSKGRLRLDVGLRLSAAMQSGEFRRNQFVYPDVRMDLAVLPKSMRLYIDIAGGENLESYASLIGRNHHVDLSYAFPGMSSLVCPSIERVSAQAGLEGRISGFFSYNLRGGYVNKAYAPLYAVVGNDGAYLPYVAYSAYQMAYAAVDVNLDVQNLRLDGRLEYRHSWGKSVTEALLPASFVADVQALYDWRERVSAGVSCQFSTAQSNGAGFEIPWYADLGVCAEYAFNRNISLWLRGGNLLNMEIQRNPLYAEKGVNFTAGISLIF